MALSFSFNGIKKEYVICERGKVRQVYNIKRNLLYIPGRIGAYLDGTDVDIKVIEQPIFFEGTDKMNLRKLEEDLAAWLITDQPAELIFSDEPDRIYYAVVDGSLNLEEIVNFNRGTITFICPEPYKQTTEFVEHFRNDSLSVWNTGSADAKPTFELEVLEPITYAMIRNQSDDYMMIGAPYDVTAETPYIREELSMDKVGNSLTGWTQGTTVDGGVVDGSFYVTTGALRAQTYGANSPEWHGPAMQMGMPDLLNDFKIQTYFTVKPRTEKSFGRAELYLLNSGGQKIAKLAMKNIGTDGGSNVGEVVLRNENTGDSEVMIRTPGIRQRLWNDFYGILRLERSNGVFNAYIAKYDTQKKEYNTAWSASFTDTDGIFDDPLASIQIHLGAYKGLQWIEDIAIHRVTVYKINQPSVASEIPYIAYAGDTIVFDHVNDNLLINGESRVDLKDFGGEYFPLNKGLNELNVIPTGSFNTKVRYRERFK